MSENTIESVTEVICKYFIYFCGKSLLSDILSNAAL